MLQKPGLKNSNPRNCFFDVWDIKFEPLEDFENTMEDFSQSMESIVVQVRDSLTLAHAIDDL